MPAVNRSSRGHSLPGWQVNYDIVVNSLPAQLQHAPQPAPRQAKGAHIKEGWVRGSGVAWQEGWEMGPGLKGPVLQQPAGARGAKLDGQTALGAVNQSQLARNR